MKVFAKFIGISMLGMALATCASTDEQGFTGFKFHDSAQDSLLADTNALFYNPQQVGIYSINHLPTQQYKILGNVSTNRYNRFGIKRNTASINQILSQKTAEMGGNAVIEFPGKNMIIGEVISLEETV